MLVLALLGVIQQPSVPVLPDHLPPPGGSSNYRCNLAVVHALSDFSTLAVRTGPGREFRKIDELANKTGVYTCNERGEWVGIVYSIPGRSCSGQPGDGLEVSRASSCRSGWVHRNWIEVLTG